MKQTELLEAIDACRYRQPDLSLPEFAGLAARVESDAAVLRSYKAVQAFDAALGAALEDVPVPAGLADRLLAAMPSADEVGGDASHGGGVSLPVARRIRSWADSLEWVVTLAVVFLFAAVIGAVGWSARPQLISPEQLVERSFEWREQLQHDNWNEQFGDAPRDDFPVGSHAALAAWRWQGLQTKEGKLVAYYEGPPEVILFVSHTKRTKVTGLSNSPKLISATGGWTIGAWQSDNLTYVLLVEGNQRQYESHLKTQPAA